MSCRAKFSRFIIAAAAILFMSSCYQTMASRDSLEVNRSADEFAQLNSQPHASVGNTTAAANMVAMNTEDAQTLCSFPARLHPVSQLFLDSYIAGRMATHEFLRAFSLPDSDYIPLARCFVTIVVDGIPMP